MRRTDSIQLGLDYEPGVAGGVARDAEFERRRARTRNFVRNPENVRALLGDITFEPDQTTRRLLEPRQAQALQSLRQITSNPKLLQGIRDMTDDRNIESTAAESYFLRSILGEQPGRYGEDLDQMSSFYDRPDRGMRGVPSTDVIGGPREIYEGEFEGQPTNELSPFDRTQQTPTELRPGRMREDLRFAAAMTQDLEDLSLRDQFMVGDVLNRLSEQYGVAQDLAQTNLDVGDNDLTFPDQEQVREMLRAPDTGTGEARSRNNAIIGDYRPREVAEAASLLDRVMDGEDFNRDQFFNDLRDTNLPNEYEDEIDVRRRYDPNFNEDAYLDSLDPDRVPDDMQSSPDYERNTGALAQSRGAKGGGSAALINKPIDVTRIGRSDLLNKYGQFMPVKGAEKKVAGSFLRNFSDELPAFASRIRLAMSTDDTPEENVRKGDIIKEIKSKAYDLEAETLKGKDPKSFLTQIDKLSKNLGSGEQIVVNAFLKQTLDDLEDKTMDVDTTRAGVGGGTYMSGSDVMRDYPSAAEKLNAFSSEAYVPDQFEVDKYTSFEGEDGNIYDLKVYRKPTYSRIAEGIKRGEDVSQNFMNMLEEKPFSGEFDIGFMARNRSAGDDFDYSDAGIPEDVSNKMLKYVANEGLEGIPGGAIIRNDPLDDEYGRTGSGGSKRGAAYQRGGGFGGNTVGGQYAYIDPDTGAGVPIQPGRQGASKARRATDLQNRGAYYASLLPGAENVDAGTLGKLASEIPQAIKSTPGLIKAAPTSLVPGAMDLVPSREAVKAGYEQGPAAMGKQMGQDFVKGIVPGAVIAAGLSRPAMKAFRKPIAIGAAALAGGELIDEVVKQETGKSVGERVAEATPDALKTRLAKAKEVFNPMKGEFGLSELLTGR